MNQDSNPIKKIDKELENVPFAEQRTGDDRAATSTSFHRELGVSDSRLKGWCRQIETTISRSKLKGKPRFGHLQLTVPKKKWRRKRNLRLWDLQTEMIIPIFVVSTHCSPKDFKKNSNTLNSQTKNAPQRISNKFSNDFRFKKKKSPPLLEKEEGFI